MTLHTIRRFDKRIIVTEGALFRHAEIPSKTLPISMFAMRDFAAVQFGQWYYTAIGYELYAVWEGFVKEVH
jgi:hypothetical protein